MRSVTVEQIGAGQTGASYRLSLVGETGPSTLVAKPATGDEDARSASPPATATRWASTASSPRGSTCGRRAVGTTRSPTTRCSSRCCSRIWRRGFRVSRSRVLGGARARRRSATWPASTPRAGTTTLSALDFLSRTTEQHAQFLGNVLGSATDEFVRYETDLEPYEVATLRAVASVIIGWQLARPEPFAVVHGDYRLDNLMFPVEGDGVAALDWQTVTVGPPARDLAYFLGTSLARRRPSRGRGELVALYHRRARRPRHRRVRRGIDASTTIDLGNCKGR